VIFDRLTAVRKALGFTDQGKFAKELQMPHRTYQTYEQGSVKGLPSPFIEKLHKLYGISIHWLITGEGEMFGNIPTLEIPILASHYRSDENALRSFLTNRTVHYDQHLLASDDTLYGFFLEDESMHPTFLKESLILLTPTEHYAGDGLYLFASQGALMLRRLHLIANGTYTLQSPNPEYEPTTLNEENLKILGRAIHHSGRV